MQRIFYSLAAYAVQVYQNIMFRLTRLILHGHVHVCTALSDCCEIYVTRKNTACSSCLHLYTSNEYLSGPHSFRAWWFSAQLALGLCERISLHEEFEVEDVSIENGPS